MVLWEGFLLLYALHFFVEFDGLFFESVPQLEFLLNNVEFLKAFHVIVFQSCNLRFQVSHSEHMLVVRVSDSTRVFKCLATGVEKVGVLVGLVVVDFLKPLGRHNCLVDVFLNDSELLDDHHNVSALEFKSLVRNTHFLG